MKETIRSQQCEKQSGGTHAHPHTATLLTALAQLQSVTCATSAGTFTAIAPGAILDNGDK